MGIGFFEICIIAIFVLIFFGPSRLPDLMREVGKFLVHAKRLSNEARSQFETLMNEAEASIEAEEKKKQQHRKAALATLPIPVAQPPHSEPHDPQVTLLP